MRTWGVAIKTNKIKIKEIRTLTSLLNIEVRPFSNALCLDIFFRFHYLRRASNSQFHVAHMNSFIPLLCLGYDNLFGDFWTIGQVKQQCVVSG